MEVDMNRKLLIVLLLAFCIGIIPIFANSVTYDNVYISWGGSALYMKNNNNHKVTVTVSVKLVNPNNEKDTKVETNITYPIASGGEKYWPVPRPYVIKEIISITVN
jgi:hypothetical protein